jgi:hypothetical protein
MYLMSSPDLRGLKTETPSAASLELREAAREVVLINLLLILGGRDGVSRSLRQAYRDL